MSTADDTETRPLADEQAAGRPASWWRRPWVLAATALIVVAAVVAVFVGTDDADAPPGPRRPPPTAEPLELTAMPWPAEVHTRPQLRDDALLFFTDNDSSGLGRLVLADARTGAHRWELPVFGEELPGTGLAIDSESAPVLVTTPTGLGVLIVYCVASCVGNPGGDGIALLSAQDGSPLWQIPTVDGDPRSLETDASTVIRGTTEDTVVVTVQPRAYQASVASAELRTLALDVRTGAQRWETRGGIPISIAGDVLLTAIDDETYVGRSPDHLTPMMDAPTATVAGLDLATGRTLWDFTDRARNAQLVTVAGNAAVVFGNDGVRQIVDVRTGRPRADLRDVANSHDCAASIDTTLIACTVRDGTAIRTFDSADGSSQVTVGDLGRGRNRIAADIVWRDRILDWTAMRTIDRAGNRIDSGLPGAIIAASGDLVLTARFDLTTSSPETTELAVQQLAR